MAMRAHENTLKGGHHTRGPFGSSFRLRPLAAAFAAVLAVLSPALAASADDTPRENRLKPQRPIRVTVFAAASLSDALREIAAAYEKQSASKIVLSFAGSGTLARQIEMGAPADLFFSADEKIVDSLERSGFLVGRKALLSNTLCVAVPLDSKLKTDSAASLAAPGVKRIAMGNPLTVPAGAYAKQWLEKTGKWKPIAAKTVPCENVRAVLAAVASGDVDAGIVFTTDVRSSKQVRIAFEVPKVEAPDIRYSVAKLSQPGNMQATAFMEYLCSKAAAAVFQKHGFVVLP